MTYFLVRASETQSRVIRRLDRTTEGTIKLLNLLGNTRGHIHAGAHVRTRHARHANASGLVLATLKNHRKEAIVQR
jgi:hypothetical protein